MTIFATYVSAVLLYEDEEFEFGIDQIAGVFV